MTDMSQKSRDGHGRWKSLTVAFRISPEDNDLLNRYVAVSGMTKQDYITNRLLNRDVVVIGNPRVHKALRAQMLELTGKISSLGCVSGLTDEEREFITHIIAVYEEMKEGKSNG